MSDSVFHHLKDRFWRVLFNSKFLKDCFEEKISARSSRSTYFEDIFSLKCSQKIYLKLQNAVWKEIHFSEFGWKTSVYKAFYHAVYLCVCQFVLCVVMFRNKRSQAKGVYYVFLYKQHMDNVYTQMAIHRSTIGSLVVGHSSSSPPQFWLFTMARESWANLTPWLTDAEPIFAPFKCFPTRFSLSLLWTCRVSVSWTL